VESLLRLVCLLDCHLLLLVCLSTGDTTRDAVNTPRMATRLWVRVECMGLHVFFACEGERLGEEFDGSCESKSGCAAGIFERDLVFPVMEI